MRGCRYASRAFGFRYTVTTVTLDASAGGQSDAEPIDLFVR